MGVCVWEHGWYIGWCIVCEPRSRGGVIHQSEQHCAINLLCVYVCVWGCLCVGVCVCVCTCVCQREYIQSQRQRQNDRNSASVKVLLETKMTVAMRIGCKWHVDQCHSEIQISLPLFLFPIAIPPPLTLSRHIYVPLPGRAASYFTQAFSCFRCTFKVWGLNSEEIWGGFIFSHTDSLRFWFFTSFYV